MVRDSCFSARSGASRAPWSPTSARSAPQQPLQPLQPFNSARNRPLTARSGASAPAVKFPAGESAGVSVLPKHAMSHIRCEKPMQDYPPTLIADSLPEEPPLSEPTTAETSTAAVSESDTDSDQCADESAPVDLERAHRFSCEETIIIFDWDDTFLPSSWVQEQGLALQSAVPLEEWQELELKELARYAIETLRVAKRLGTVVLVTNAERGWIELSCTRFLPTLLPLLEGLKLVSARTLYESARCPTPCEWKIAAFSCELDRVFGRSDDRRKNILSIGDSTHEREAVLVATAPLKNCRTKSLKFVERPKLDQLCRQHLLMASCLRRIVHHDGNLDVVVQSH